MHKLIKKVFSQSNINHRSDAPSLELETLETRNMLSSVDIFAGGFQGNEQFDLLVNGEVVASFEANRHSSRGVFTGVTNRFSYDSCDSLTPDQLSIAFTNAISNPGNPNNNGLLIDKIVVDGETIETESQFTFIDFQDDSKADGFLQTEQVFGNNARFNFAQDNTGAPLGTRVRIDAIGDTGLENLQLQINGETVKNFRFAAADTLQSFFYTSNEVVDVSQLKIRFTNDSNDVIDRNLTVKSFQTIDANTGDRQIANVARNKVFVVESEFSNGIAQAGKGIFSRGVYTDTDGIAPGFGRGDTLAANGFFEVRGTDVTQRIRIDAAGQTGNEKFEVYFGGKLRGTFNTSATESSYFIDLFDVPQSQIDSLVVKFINDQYDPVAGLDNNLTVSNIQLVSFFQDGRGPTREPLNLENGTGTRLIERPDGSTFRSQLNYSVYSSGTFLDNDGIVGGFDRGDTLHANGYFQAVSNFRISQYVGGFIG